ncbi:hypothetical protein VIGAN_06179700 [Vigna angularis var. angularis]|uniref:Protein kinase domain-containing protein n=1 Tax=Vigna angularis var. angularis TaxID=157739 RepID=A0A0S3SCD2_PHAAN|nr:hypothetical protein VIGAN_06179700 [Vigna angularis var. angularis]
MTFLSPHPNIFKIIDAFQDAHTSTIVLQLYQPRTLFPRGCMYRFMDPIVIPFRSSSPSWNRIRFPCNRIRLASATPSKSSNRLRYSL